MPILSLVTYPFRAVDFRRYMMFWAAWSFAVNVAGPFFNVYMLEDLHLGYLRLSLYSQLLSTTATVLFVRVWGRLADALGGKPVMTVCCAGAASIPRSGFLPCPAPRSCRPS